MRCLKTFAAAGLFVALAFADGRHNLNGTWTLEPTRSELAGEPALETGSVTINDRQHNIYVSRNFTYDGATQTTAYSFSTDGRENASIKDGKAFKSKAKWDGDVLRVTTVQGDETIVERYSLNPDGTLVLAVERKGPQPITLYFHRQ